MLTGSRHLTLHAATSRTIRQPSNKNAQPTCGQNFICELDGSLDALSGQLYIDQLLVLCESDAEKGNDYRYVLADRARQLPYCPHGKLIARKHSESHPKAYKYAHDCFIIQSFINGEHSAAIKNVFSFGSSMSTSVLNSTMSLNRDKQSSTPVTERLAAPDISAMLYRIQSDITPLHKKVDNNTHNIDRIVSELSALSTTSKIVHGTINSIKAATQTYSILQKLDSLESDNVIIRSAVQNIDTMLHGDHSSIGETFPLQSDAQEVKSNTATNPPSHETFVSDRNASQYTINDSISDEQLVIDLELGTDAPHTSDANSIRRYSDVVQNPTPSRCNYNKDKSCQASAIDSEINKNRCNMTTLGKINNKPVPKHDAHAPTSEPVASNIYDNLIPPKAVPQSTSQTTAKCSKGTTDIKISSTVPSGNADEHDIRHHTGSECASGSTFMAEENRWNDKAEWESERAYQRRPQRPRRNQKHDVRSTARFDPANRARRRNNVSPYARHVVTYDVSRRRDGSYGASTNENNRRPWHNYKAYTYSDYG